MAIFLTSTLLIISMTFIPLTEGMEKGNQSGSKNASGPSAGPCKIGKLENPYPNLLKLQHQTLPSKEDKANMLKVTSKTKDLQNTKIILEVGGIRCEASIKNTKGEECKIPSKEIKKGPQSGTLIFSYAEGKEVVVPFKDVHLFNANVCEIVLEKYDINKNILDFILNGFALKVVPDEKKC
uniref:Uncharacterized protein n=1 Tax=Meloidogyne enterolobii TaxID=390850 RepID=A0A6V7ULA8_MELEN|nr:unnamed protein product [Meloidogyne enterolobii]